MMGVALSLSNAIPSRTFAPPMIAVSNFKKDTQKQKMYKFVVIFQLLLSLSTIIHAKDFFFQKA